MLLSDVPPSVKQGGERLVTLITFNWKMVSSFVSHETFFSGKDLLASIATVTCMDSLHVPSEVLTSRRFIITFLTLEQRWSLFGAEDFMRVHSMMVHETSAIVTKTDQVILQMSSDLGVLFMLEVTHMTLIHRG